MAFKVRLFQKALNRQNTENTGVDLIQFLWGAGIFWLRNRVREQTNKSQKLRQYRGSPVPWAARETKPKTVKQVANIIRNCLAKAKAAIQGLEPGPELERLLVGAVWINELHRKITGAYVPGVLGNHVWRENQHLENPKND